uniref:Bravo_FIGEY domain-containing protein n=1 Tax=Soboliphyme baturini TaxID=241478 RepID=A0A183I989_9BILA
LVHPDGGNFTVSIQNLSPGTVYEVTSVSVVDTEQGGLETESPVNVFTTEGDAPGIATAGWLIAILVAIMILIIVLIIVCLVIRNRGAKYPVSEKEKEQGREPMLKDDKGFDEYTHPDVDEDKQSLTGRSKGESENDSMAEYGDGETGRFTEDGSFIGQYGVPNRVFIKPGSDRNRTDLSTFV